MISQTRFYQKTDLTPLLKKHRRSSIVVFDLETNGLRPGSSILSCSAVKLVMDGHEDFPHGEKSPSGPLRQVDFFERFYFSMEPENPSAVQVNGLSSYMIEKYRDGKSWPLYYADDPSFEEFCRDAGLFVAHNIDFDAQFLPFLDGRDQFCTMKSNTRSKFPKLSELAVSFGIEVKASRLHGSTYDTMITAEIFQRMAKEVMPDVEQGDLFF